MSSSGAAAGGDLRARLASLSPAQRALLEQRLRERAPAPASDRDRIERRPSGADAPLTPQQELLWTLDQAMPGLVAYNVPRLLRIDGELDLAALQSALDGLVARHEVLRSVVVPAAAGARQVVRDAAPVPLQQVDLRTMDEPARSVESDRVMREQATYAFDLSRDQLLRATVVREGEARWRLLLLTHHIACDEGSRDVTFRELGELYAAARAGRNPELSPLPIQFADYARWQRAALDGGALGASVQYWRDRLRNLEPLELATDRPRATTPSFAGARVRRLLSPELLRRLRELSREHSTTPFVTLLAAFTALLHRYTGSGDVAVASPVSGRGLPDLDGLIGYFSNTLVLRTAVDGDRSFAALLRDTRETVLAAFEHQDVPLEAVRDRGASVASATPVAFVMQGDAATSVVLPGASVTPELTDLHTAKLDLLLGAVERENGLLLQFEYRRELFDATTVERMLGHLETLLAHALAAPDTPVGELPMLDAAERALVVEQWNDTAAPWPDQATLASLVAEQVARTPDAVALVHGDGTLRYAELAARAYRLARHLRALGAAPEVCVGICLPRTPELVVAVLAVHAAGAAYVPLDPAYPDDRVSYMLADSGAPLVITDLANAHRVAGAAHGTRPIVIDLPDTRAEIDAWPSDAPPVAAGPTALAYVIYTSGSTGRPKGVAIEHRSAVALVSWAQGVYSAAELSGVLAATSICFDLSVFELFVPLASGGSVILAENALALPELPAGVRERVTLVNTVPSAAAALVRAGGVPQSVQTVNLAGEPLSAGLVDALYGLGTVGRVYDLYGPSEDTTYSTGTLRRAGGPVTIGRPIANTRAYVLDGAGAPRPVGLAGELYLGGAGLARGYLGQPALTAERFVAHPGAGARLYRTGDRVRWRGDGTLEYLGRLDFQVKIRGFRVELGEIERALSAHPAVRDAAVIVRDAGEGDVDLVAFIVPVADSGLRGEPDAPQAAALRAHLAATLPEYMLPASFVALDALPLTPSGKVDRKALRPPERRAAAGRAYVAPATPTERALADIWAAALGVERVGATDGFVELGGHSLLAMRVVGQVRRELGAVLPLSALLQGRTLTSCAALIAERPVQPAEGEALAPVSREAFVRGTRRVST